MRPLIGSLAAALTLAVTLVVAQVTATATHGIAVTPVSPTADGSGMTCCVEDSLID